MKKNEEEIRDNWVYQQPEDEEEILPLDQQRRLGLDIDMIGAREEYLCSTRSHTLEMSLQEIKLWKGPI